MRNKTSAVWEMSVPRASNLSSKEFTLECLSTSFVFSLVTSPGFGTTITDYTAPQCAASSESFDIYLFIFAVEAFSCQIQSQEKCFNSIFPELIQKQYLAVTVLIPSYGLLTQKIPKVLYFCCESLLCCLMCRDRWRKPAAHKAFSEHVILKSDVRVWFQREIFRRQYIISWSGNSRDGRTLCTKYNKYYWGISLNANYQDLHLFSHAKMHYLSLVLWFYVNKLGKEI